MQESYSELIKSGLDICFVWLCNSLAWTSQIGLSRLRTEGSVKAKWVLVQGALSQVEKCSVPEAYKNGYSMGQ